MKTIKLVSQHQVNDAVKLTFGKKSLEYTVVAVKFTHIGEVLYDIYVNTPDSGFIIKDIGSTFVEKLEK